MKRLLLIIICIILCACSGKSLSWESVSEKYVQAEQSAADLSADKETFLAADYKNILNDLKDKIDSIKGVDEELFLSIYEKASSLEKSVSIYDNENSSLIKSLAEGIKELIRSYYDKETDQTSIKDRLDQEFDTVLSWSDDEWAAVEKRKMITWNEVEEEYAALEENAIANMTPRKDVTENELQDLCGVIINNYQSLAYGVNDYCKDKADAIYEAAVILKEYTEKLKGNAAEKVFNLADDAISYVRSCYGLSVSDEDYDFINRVQGASKYSLSTWNEITTQLKR